MMRSKNRRVQHTEEQYSTSLRTLGGAVAVLTAMVACAGALAEDIRARPCA
jgi:hypothetical protein